MVSAKKGQTKIDSYFEEIIEEANDLEERNNILNTRIKFYSELSQFPQGTPAIDKISAHNRKVGLKIRKVRYEDLFDELMFYMNEDEINKISEYQEALDNVLSKGRVKPSKKSTMKNNNYNRMFNKLLTGLISTNRAKEFFINKKRELVRPETIKRTSERTGVKEERINELLINKKKVYRVFKDDKQTIVYLSHYVRNGKTVVVYRDLKGRFTKNPEKI